MNFVDFIIFAMLMAFSAIKLVTLKKLHTSKLMNVCSLLKYVLLLCSKQRNRNRKNSALDFSINFNRCYFAIDDITRNINCIF